MIKDKLVSELEKLGYEVFLQGSLSEDKSYPESFITYWTDDTADNAHYDNDTTAYEWYFSVIFYSNKPALVNSEPDKIRKALKAAGFMPQGKGRDIPSDEPTHAGWAQDYIYIEYGG